MNLQKINWKLFFKDPKAAKPDTFFKVFNSWIPDSPEIFVDVADYQHVHDGPLTALVGHYVDYYLDDTGRRLGLLYSRRQGPDGSNEERISQTLKEILAAADRLEGNPEFGGNLQFSTSEILLIANDRALAPNRVETFNAIRPDLEKVLVKLFGKNQYSLTHLDDPRRRFSVSIVAKQSFSIKELLNKI